MTYLYPFSCLTVSALASSRQTQAEEAGRSPRYRVEAGDFGLD